MDSTILFGVALVPAIVGLTEVAKQLGLPGKAAPALAVLLGIAGAMAQTFGHDRPWIAAAVVGIGLGLSASGLYSGVRTVISDSPVLTHLVETGTPTTAAEAVATPAVAPAVSPRPSTPAATAPVAPPTTDTTGS